jgi:hypothetical protein
LLAATAAPEWSMRCGVEETVLTLLAELALFAVLTPTAAGVGNAADTMADTEAVAPAVGAGVLTAPAAVAPEIGVTAIGVTALVAMAAGVPVAAGVEAAAPLVSAVPVGVTPAVKTVGDGRLGVAVGNAMGAGVELVGVSAAATAETAGAAIIVADAAETPAEAGLDKETGVVRVTGDRTAGAAVEASGAESVREETIGVETVGEVIGEAIGVVTEGVDTRGVTNAGETSGVDVTGRETADAAGVTMGVDTTGVETTSVDNVGVDNVGVETVAIEAAGVAMEATDGVGVAVKLARIGETVGVVTTATGTAVADVFVSDGAELVPPPLLTEADGSTAAGATDAVALDDELELSVSAEGDVIACTAAVGAGVDAMAFEGGLLVAVFDGESDSDGVFPDAAVPPEPAFGSTETLALLTLVRLAVDELPSVGATVDPAGLATGVEPKAVLRERLLAEPDVSATGLTATMAGGCAMAALLPVAVALVPRPMSAVAAGVADAMGVETVAIDASGAGVAEADCAGVTDSATISDCVPLAALADDDDEEEVLFA